MRKALVYLLVILAVFSFAGCSKTADNGSATAPANSTGTATGDTTTTPAASSKNFSVVTGPVGGSMYVISGSWADIANKKVPGIQVTNQVGGGSVLCARVLGKGEADFGMVGNDIAYYASRGEEDFKDNAMPQIRAVAALYAEGFHVIVPKKSGMAKMEDLTNKVTSIGPAGSGTLLNSERVLAAYGFSDKDVGAKQLGFDESAQAISDGHVDAACYMTGIPYGPVMNIAVTTPINAFGLSDTAIDNLMKKYPFFVKMHYPADTYKGAGAFDTIAVRMLLVTTDKVDEESVYQLTKLLVENIDQIAASNACGSTISKETLLDGLSVPLHPGAERYYKEIGLIK